MLEVSQEKQKQLTFYFCVSVDIFLLKAIEKSLLRTFRDKLKTQKKFKEAQAGGYQNWNNY